MDARSAAVDFRSRRGRPGASPPRASEASGGQGGRGTRRPSAAFSDFHVLLGKLGTSLGGSKAEAAHDLDVAVGILRYDGYQGRRAVAFQNRARRADDGMSTAEIGPCHPLAVLENECLRRIDH